MIIPRTDSFRTLYFIYTNTKAITSHKPKEGTNQAFKNVLLLEFLNSERDSIQLLSANRLRHYFPREQYIFSALYNDAHGVQNFITQHCITNNPF